MPPAARKLLLTVYVNHLKSKYTEAKSGPARELELKEAAERRSMQAETLIEIVERKQRPNGRYVVLGDMNDTPTSKSLESFKDLVNGLKQIEERGGTPNFGDTPPVNKRWTHRFKESGARPPAYELFDQVWLSPELAKRQTDAFILRRTKVTRDGTDHDPAWVGVELDL